MKTYRIFLMLLCLTVLACLLLIGHTWHLVPTYIACLIVSLILIFRKYKKRKILTIITCALLLSTTAFSFYLFPFISLPKPTGEHQMGVVYRTVDSRIDAAINMDGLQYGSFIDDTTKVPILMLENQWSPYNLSIHSPFFKRSLKRVDCLKFLDTKHFNFTDECLISPLMKNFGYLGEADRKGILDIRNKVVPDFFITTFGYSQFNSKNYEEEGKIIALNK